MRHKTLVTAMYLELFMLGLAVFKKM